MGAHTRTQPAAAAKSYCLRPAKGRTERSGSFSKIRRFRLKAQVMNFAMGKRRRKSRNRSLMRSSSAKVLTSAARPVLADPRAGGSSVVGTVNGTGPLVGVK